MKFTLQKSTNSTAALSKFHVRNAAGDIVGSINVHPSEEADLLKHWLGATPAPRAATAGKENPAVAAMLAAAGRNKLSKQAILRG